MHRGRQVMQVGSWQECMFLGARGKAHSNNLSWCDVRSVQLLPQFVRLKILLVSPSLLFLSIPLLLSTYWYRTKFCLWVLFIVKSWVNTEWIRYIFYSISSWHLPSYHRAEAVHFSRQYSLKQIKMTSFLVISVDNTSVLKPTTAASCALAVYIVGAELQILENCQNDYHWENNMIDLT